MFSIKRVFSISLFLILAFSFTGCGTGPKIVIPSYTAPKEVAKLKKIETKDEVIAKGAYLAVWINPDVKGTSSTNPKLKDILINNIKTAITQTNFIALDPLGETEGVALNMKVIDYNFKLKSSNEEELDLIVSFSLTRGVDEFFVKTYETKEIRRGKMMPSEDSLAYQASKKLVRMFISDISPLKTYQLREFKSLPSELKYVVSYAKRKNYKGAIKLMENYKGEKDLNYYYNLAVLYEALASTTEDLKFLKQAQINYERALEKGGITDELVMKAKARFDKFYDLLKQTKKIQKNNEELINDRNSLAGSSDDEYE